MSKSGLGTRKRDVERTMGNGLHRPRAAAAWVGVGVPAWAVLTGMGREGGIPGEPVPAKV